MKNCCNDVYMIGCGFMFGCCMGDDADSVYLSIIVTVVGIVDDGSCCDRMGLLYVTPYRLVWFVVVNAR